MVANADDELINVSSYVLVAMVMLVQTIRFVEETFTSTRQGKRDVTS